MKSQKSILAVLLFALASLLFYKNSEEHYEAKSEVSSIVYPTSTIVKANNAEELKQKLIFEVFGKDGFPQSKAIITEVEEFEGRKFKRLSTDAKLFENGSDRLLIFHAGHKQDAVKDDAGGPLLRYALANKYDVLLLNMPTGDHSRFASLRYPLTEFMKPVAESLNYALSAKRYRSVTMSGLSGGGWTTVLYAALDERINKSVPVAGSWPKYLRYQSGNVNSIGDYEQTLPGLSVEYLDLYALATTKGRQQLQVFNSNDPCCFNGDAALSYLDQISQVAKQFGGSFEIEIVESNKHEVNSKIFNRIASK